MVLMDAIDPFGNGHLLPWGSLREPVKELSRADAFILTRFSRAQGKQGGMQNPFIFMVLCVLIQTLLASLLRGNPAIIVANLAFGTLFPLITAGILFLIITQLFKGQGTYEMAFRVNAYSAAVALFSWIPLVGMVLEFYRLYLIGVGLGCTFSIRGSQAFLAIVLTLIVYIIASGALAHLTGAGLPLTAG